MSSVRKTITTFIFIIYFLNGYTQEYPIPASDSRWGGLTMFGPPGLPGAGLYGNIEHYTIKDTLINNISFQHWGGVYTRYLNNKLYLLDTLNSTSDSLVEDVYYDFNLEVNDSFLVGKPVHSYAIVTETSQFKSLNGQIRKRILLRGKSFTLDWIEGIGDIWNGVFYHYQIGLYDVHWLVVCYSDSSGEVYKQEGFDYPCDSLDGYIDLFDTTQVEKNSVLQNGGMMGYPNPFSDQIFINTSTLPEYTSISIFNSKGEVLIKTTKRVIDTSALKPGFYILKIEGTKGNYFRKIMKQ